MFKNAEIISADTPFSAYSTQLYERGHAKFVMSRSELASFDHCPSRWIAGHKEKQSEEMAWGSLMDCLALTPDRFNDLFAVYPTTYPDDKGNLKPWNNNATHCREWKKERAGKTFLHGGDAEEAKRALSVLYADEDASALLACSQRQVMVMAEWHDRESELVVPVKALIDLVPNKGDERYGKSLADLKTDSCADPSVWEKSVFNRGYDIQGALYLDLYTAATKEDRVDFRHVIQENFAPYQTARRILSQEYIELGRSRYTNALKFYCYCLSQNNWPDYEGRGRTVLDGWTLAEPAAWMLDTANRNWGINALAKHSETFFANQNQ